MTSAPNHVRMLSQLMQAAEVRHRVVSQNIANVNTPGYLSREVEFEAELARRIRSGAEVDPREAKPVVRLEEGLAVRADGNNVDIDQEIGRLGKNALLHQTYGQLLANYFQTMQRAMRNG